MRSFFGFKGAREDSPARRVSLDEAMFVVLDLEMTGLSAARDSIIAIGAVKMQGGRIDLGQSFSSLVKPRTKLSAEGIKVHRLLPDELQPAPEPDVAFKRFRDYCAAAVLVGYCLDVDIPFLEAEAKRSGAPLAKSRQIDVLELYRVIRVERASTLLEDLPAREVSLYHMASALGISVKGAHDALADACITAQVFQRFLWILRASRGETLDLDALVKAGNRFSAQSRGAVGGGGGGYMSF